MADKPAPLVPIREEMVPFYEDEIPAVLIEVDGLPEPEIYVPVRPVCEFIGVDWSAQRRRINRDPVLSRHVMSVVVTATQIESARGQRASQDMLCLPLQFLHGFLFGINASRAKPEVRDSLIRYQTECYGILHGAFSRDRREAESAFQRIEAVALSVAELSREAGENIGRIDQRVDRAAMVVRDLAIEVSAIKQRLSLGQPITPAQAQAIKSRVNETAGLLGEVPGFGGRRKPHAAVWSEIYRRFGVPSYNELRLNQSDDVIDFLDKWSAEIRGTLDLAEGNNQ